MKPIKTTIRGLDFWFEAIFWYGQVPFPSLVKKHLVTWNISLCEGNHAI